MVEPNWRLSFTYQTSKFPTEFNHILVLQEDNSNRLIGVYEVGNNLGITSKGYGALYENSDKYVEEFALNVPYDIEIQQIYSEVDGIYKTIWKVNGNQVGNKNTNYVQHISEVVLLSPGSITGDPDNDVTNYSFEVIPTGKLSTLSFYIILYHYVALSSMLHITMEKAGESTKTNLNLKFFNLYIFNYIQDINQFDLK